MINKQTTVTTTIKVLDQSQTTPNLITTNHTAIITFENGQYKDVNIRQGDNSTSYTVKLKPEFLRELADTIEKGIFTS